MDKETNEKQFDIDLGLTLNRNNEVLIRRFMTNGWPATLLVDIFATISAKIKKFYGSVQYPDNLVAEADGAFNKLIEKAPDVWDESQRNLFRLRFLHQRYTELYQTVNALKCEISKLRNEKCINNEITTI